MSFLTGFITISDTIVTTGTVAVGTVTAVARVAVNTVASTTGTANMAGKLMSTNDVVSWSPRTFPLNSAGVPVSITYMRVKAVESASVNTATAIIELGLLSSSSGASATAIANTFDISVALKSTGDT